LTGKRKKANGGFISSCLIAIKSGLSINRFDISAALAIARRAKKTEVTGIMKEAESI